MSNNVIRCTDFLQQLAIPYTRKVMCVIFQYEQIWQCIMHGSPLIAFLMFFQVSAAVSTWQQLHLLKLIISLIVLMVENVLTQGKHGIAHLVITVPMYITGQRQVWG
jgi:hypothetical protein